MSVQLSGQSFKALTEWGKQAAVQNQYAEAYHWYSLAHDMAPHATDIFPLLGEAAFHTKNYRDCCHWFDLSVENKVKLNPGQVMQHIECKIRQRQYGSALITIRETFHQAADSVYYRVMESWCQFAMEPVLTDEGYQTERLGKPFATDENERAPAVHDQHLYFWRGDSLVVYNSTPELISLPVPVLFYTGQKHYNLRTIAAGTQTMPWFGTACPIEGAPPANCIIVAWSGSEWVSMPEINAEGAANIHPFFAADETPANNGTLWFASDREGGFGGFDIWYSRVTENYFSEPVNAGSYVNTVMNEWSPFADGENTLYFASNGHPGYGGYDIYRVGANLDSAPQNLGPEVNSSFDEHYFTGSSVNTGYFSSDRPANPATFSGTCCFNLFSWERLPEPEEEKLQEPVDADLTANADKELSLINKHKQRLEPCTLLFHNDVPSVRWMNRNLDYRALQKDLTGRKDVYIEHNTTGRDEIRKIMTAAGQSLIQLDSMMASVRFLADREYQLTVSAYGHASPRWRADYNLLLSARRLESVKRYIARHHADLLQHPNVTWLWQHYGDQKSKGQGGSFAEIYTPEALLERRVTVSSAITSSPQLP